MVKLRKLVEFTKEWQSAMATPIWAREKFTTEWRNSVDDDSPGRPLGVTCIEANDQVDKHIRNNRRINIADITSEMYMMKRMKLCKNGFNSNKKRVQF
jgi:hypothetical protein